MLLISEQCFHEWGGRIRVSYVMHTGFETSYLKRMVSKVHPVWCTTLPVIEFMDEKTLATKSSYGICMHQETTLAVTKDPFKTYAYFYACSRYWSLRVLVLVLEIA